MTDERKTTAVPDDLMELVITRLRRCGAAGLADELEKLALSSDGPPAGDDGLLPPLAVHMHIYFQHAGPTSECESCREHAALATAFFARATDGAPS